MLSGVNKKCAKCTGVCKQWRQITIIYCPNFVFKSSKPKNHVDSTQEKTPVVAIHASVLSTKEKIGQHLAPIGL